MKQANITKHALEIMHNENDIRVTNKGRIFADCSTTAFVNTFIQDDIKRVQFVDYIYHKINSSVLLKLNDILIEKYDKPFMNNENFQLVYKGGNIMNMHGLIYIEELKNHIFDNKKEHELDQNITSLKRILSHPITVGGKNVDNIMDFLDGFKNNLKVSDVDFAAHIFADCYYNHYRAYEIVKEIIYTELVQIREFFDGLLDKKTTFYDSEEFEENFSKEIIAEYVFIDNVVTCIKHKRNVNIDDSFLDPLSMDLLNNIIHSFNKFKNHNNISYLLKFNEYITYYLYFKKDINQENNQNLINSKLYINNKIVQIINYKEKLVYDSNFYANIDSLKDNLCTELEKIEDNVPYYKIINDIDKEEITQIQKIQTPSPSDIHFVKRDDFFLNCSNTLDFFKKDVNNVKNIHYITYNNVINLPLFKGFLAINFDLMRIKFNIEASNFLTNSKNDKKIKIPSEFLDISFSQYSDVFYDHVIKYDSIIFSDNNNKTAIQVCAYNPEQICDDLEYVLFTQTYFCPWLDFKYQKRLARLIYFYFIDIYYIYNIPKQTIIPVIGEGEGEYKRLTKLHIIKEVFKIIKKIYNIIKLGNNRDKLMNCLKKYNICNGENLDFLIDNHNAETAENIPFYSLIKINAVYNKYKKLLAHIFTFSILNYKPDDIYLQFMNFNRKQYNYVQITDLDFIAKNKKKFIELLETCIIYFELFYTLGDKIKIDIPSVQMGGRSKTLNTRIKQNIYTQLIDKKQIYKEHPRIFARNIIDDQLNVIMTDNANLIIIAPVILETKKEATYMSINDYVDLD